MGTLLLWVGLTRWREWLQSKVLFIAAMAMLLAPESPRLILCMATVIPWAAFGYAVNDIADAACDHRAGKTNGAASLSASSRLWFVLISGGAALACTALWARDVWGFLLVGLGLLVSVLYSCPPVRLKERGFWGVSSAAFAQWGLPVLAMASVVPGGASQSAALSASLLGTTIGIRWMALHQLADRAADVRAGVRTCASRGVALWPCIVGAFAAELALLCTTLALTWPQSSPALAALLVWGTHRGAVGFGTGLSFPSALGTYSHAPLAEFYFALMPLALAAVRAPGSLEYLLLGLTLLGLGAGNLAKLLRECRACKQSPAAVGPGDQPRPHPV